jgi:pimeloyl-ACP methyl ester carboxylesterase
VLLHGFLGSGEIWKNFSRRLKESFKVISIDLPGHGKSDVPASVNSLDTMAEAVRHVLKSLEINSCLMAGHSMGGYVTLAFADMYPRLLKGFVLFHSHAAADSPEASANRDRTVALVQKDHHGFIKNFIPDLFHSRNVSKFQEEIEKLKLLAGATPKEGIVAALQAMKIRPDRQHVLLNSNVPVLFIIGKHDKRIPMELIIPQTLLPAHSEVLMLDQVGHMGFVEASVATCDAIRSFAERMF